MFPGVVAIYIYLRIYFVAFIKLMSHDMIGTLSLLFKLLFIQVYLCRVSHY